MTPQEHYNESERLIAKWVSEHYGMKTYDSAELVAVAQVHATLSTFDSTRSRLYVADEGASE